MVLAVDPGAKTITISHREITGLMPAMVMEFPLARQRETGGHRAGCAHYVRADWRSALRSDKRETRPRGAADGNRTDPAHGRGTVQLGEAVPDFQLTDERGEPFRLEPAAGAVRRTRFHLLALSGGGHVPAPVQRTSLIFNGTSTAGLELVSVTMDPKWDEPGVLLDYSKRWGAGF